MPRKVKLIFQVPMTGKTIGKDGTGTGYSGDDWYKKRAEIFEKYTLKSLIQQTNRDFLLWVTFRSQEILNPITKVIAHALAVSGMNNIMSFNGTMFTEDRAVWHNGDLKERLEKCLPNLKEMIGNSEYVYETNLDSDDTLHKKFSEIVQNKEFKEKGALYMQKGFVYNTQGRVADWFCPTSQQNYTIMFPVDIYFNAEKRLEYLDGFKTHEEIPEKFNAEKLPDGLYCSIIHGDNITTEWSHPFRDREYYYEDEKQNIIRDFF